MNKLVWSLAPALLAGCGVLSPKPPPAPARVDGVKIDPSFRATAVGKRPAVLGLAREGDPYPVLAVAVRVGAGPVVATGLSAIVDARLSRAKVPAETHVTRLGFDVRIAASGAPGATDAAIKQAIVAVRQALLTPIAAGSKDADDDLKLAGARVLALRAQVVDDDALGGVVLCSGELRLLRSEAKADTLVVTAQSLESARSATVGDSTVALGVVGPVAALEAAQRALSAEAEWPTATPQKTVWPTSRSEGAYIRGDRGPSLLSVALRVPVRSAALRVAERAADPSSPLIARLRALPAPFRTRRVAATVHEEGGCVTVEAESDPRTGTAAGDAAVAASAALVIEHELLAELAERADDAVASSQIRALADPRDAAAAAANWALSRDAGGVTAPSPTLPVFAFGASAPKAKEEPAAVATAFSAALLEGERAWSRSAIENRVAVEQNQGQLWLLLASPCPPPEPSAHAGLTALTLEALASSGVHQGVSVEPWIAPDGHGLLVHAARQPNESSEALATRVSNAAARLLSLDPPSAQAVIAARTALLPRLDTPAEESRARLAATLFPTAITRLVPWGSAASVGRLDGADARVRWSGFATGPLRAAVLANDDSAQATAALRAIDRWIPRTARPRTCAAVDDGKIAPDPLTFQAEPSKGVAPVYLIYPFDGATTVARTSATWLATAASGQGSPIGAALGPGTRTGGWVAGRGASSLLVIELSPTSDGPDAGIAAARAAAAKLGADPLGSPRANEARQRTGEDIDARRLSPRERVIGLWRGDTALTLPPDAELKAFASNVLREPNARVVRSAAPPKP